MILTFKITPVQPFISSSRSVDDYHSGSLMLSMISYWAMKYLLSKNKTNNEIYKIEGREWKYEKCIENIYNERILTGNLGLPHKFQFKINNTLIKKEIDDLKEKIKNSILYNLKLLLSNNKNSINNHIDKYKGGSGLSVEQIIDEMIGVFKSYFTFSLEGLSDHNLNKHNYDNFHNYNNNLKNFNKKCDLFEKYEAIWVKNGNDTASTIENISYLSMLKKVFIEIVCNEKKNELFNDDKEKMLAITFIDGDKIGNFIRECISENIKDFYNKFSSFLDDFIFDKKHGVISVLKNEDKKTKLIYAGGDDIVFISTVDIAWEINKKIYNNFKTLAKKFTNENNIKNNSLSISSAIVYYKNKTPFSRLNKLGHKILEKSSKENLGRNAITFYLIKNNTEYGWGDKWDKLINKDLLTNNINFFQKNISESDIFKIQNILLTYSETDDSFFIEQNYHYINKKNEKYLDKLIAGTVLKYIVENKNLNKLEILNELLSLIKTEKKDNIHYDLFALKIANFMNESKKEK